MKLRKFELVDQETNDVVGIMFAHFYIHFVFCGQSRVIFYSMVLFTGYIYMDLFDRPLKRFTTFTIRASHQNYDSTTRFINILYIN